MILDKVFEPFVRRSPVSVMLRGTLEHVVTREPLDQLFVETAQRQYSRELLFSAVVDLLGLVVCGVRKSVNEAYEAHQEQFAVSVRSVYNKLSGVETAVSRELVRRTARPLAELVRRLGTRRKSRLGGYRVKIIDGNHLPATEHRLKELRTTRRGPLPGQALVVLEPELMLVTDVFPCEDGHAQERSILPEVLPNVQRDDLWMADRNFCTTAFLFGIADRQARFLIRQHASTLTYELLGRRRKIGRSSTGMVYEQAMRIDRPDGKSLVIRRITVELDQPTRDGEWVIHLVSNVPKRRAPAVALAEGYLGRWTIENAFQELGQALNSEIHTLAYPKAALLSFCVAVWTYNVISVLKTALEAAHGEEAQRHTISGYYLASELSAAYHGMMIAVEPWRWKKEFGHRSVASMARVLKELAAGVRIEWFKKRVRGPKKPRPRRTSGTRYHHVSTARLLAQRNTKTYQQ
jgi:IS4 transposase